MLGVPSIESNTTASSASDLVRFWSSLLGLGALAWAGAKKMPPISTHIKVNRIEQTLLVQGTKLDSIDRNVNSLIIALGARPRRKKR